MKCGGFANNNCPSAADVAEGEGGFASAPVKKRKAQASGGGGGGYAYASYDLQPCLAASIILYLLHPTMHCPTHERAPGGLGSKRVYLCCSSSSLTPAHSTPSLTPLRSNPSLTSPRHSFVGLRSSLPPSLPPSLRSLPPSLSPSLRSLAPLSQQRHGVAVQEAQVVQGVHGGRMGVVPDQTNVRRVCEQAVLGRRE